MSEPQQSEAVTLAQIRAMCCVEVAQTDIGKRAHAFALKIWQYLERSHPERQPQDWQGLLTAERPHVCKQGPEGQIVHCSVCGRKSLFVCIKADTSDFDKGMAAADKLRGSAE